MAEDRIALGDLTPEDQDRVRREQEAAREKLTDLLATLTGTGGADSQPYDADAVAAVASPWIDPEDGLQQPEVAWPGPALPGDPAGPDVGCVTATGDQAQALLDAAGSATAATPCTPSATPACWPTSCPTGACCRPARSSSCASSRSV